jgi:large subunit ribosomal protein L5
MKENKLKNIMRKIELSKLVLNIGGTGEKLDRGYILLEKLSGKKPVRVKATKRIPTWNVRPGLEVGVKVTLRGEEAKKMLRRLLPAIENTLKEKQIKENFFSFGIHEYIEIPDMQYIREVGIMGFEATVVFLRAGKRVELKKAKRGKQRRQHISSLEIQDILEKEYGVKILKKRKKEETEQ